MDDFVLPLASQKVSTQPKTLPYNLTVWEAE
jgi:hypothetical protein